MVAGRPRTVSLPPDEMIALGKEMIKWVGEHPDALHLSAWYSIEKEYTEKQWEAMQQMPEFLPYYEKALKMIGQKYLDKNSNVREGISQRWQRVYFKDLKRQEDRDIKEKLDNELAVKKKIIDYETQAKILADANKGMPPNDAKLDDILESIKEKSNDA